MSRDIKFRAWLKETQIMFGQDQHGIEYVWIADDKGNPAVYWILEQDQKQEPEDIELMQYTGLKDKNGTDVYEGDKVELTYWWFDGNEAESTLLGTVVYIPERASFGLEGVKNEEWLKHIGAGEENDTLAFADVNYNPDDMEVIGNEYEN